jgi:putative tricarboxylic transport membrane protein
MGFGGMREWTAKRDRNLWANLFLLVFSGAAAREAYRFNLGNLHSPGPGFIVFGASSLLGLLALHLVLKSLLAKEPTEKFSITWKRIGRVGLVSVAISIYIVLLEPVGYLLTTFFIMGFLFRILGEGKWVSSVVGAALISFLTYVVFSYGFALHFPRGVLRFF